MSKKIDFSEVAFKNVGFEITNYRLKKYNPPVYMAISFYKHDIILGCEKTIEEWISYFKCNQMLLGLIIRGSIIPVDDGIYGSIPLKLTIKDKERLIRHLLKIMKLKLTKESIDMLIIQLEN